MSRIIVCTQPLDGHFNPFEPILAALTLRGHEVVCIAGRKYEQRIRAAGAVFHPVPEQWDPGEEDLFEIHPQLSRLTGARQIKYYLKYIIIDQTPDYLLALQALLKQFPADLVISDFIVKAGLWIRDLGGPPNIGISVVPLALPGKGLAPMGLGLLPGTTFLSRLRNDLLESLLQATLFKDISRHALKVARPIGLKHKEGNPRLGEYLRPSFMLQMSVPGFEYHRAELPANFHFIGPARLCARKDFEAPRWWPILREGRPVILINQGTVAKNPDDLISPAIEALRDEDFTVIAVPARTEDFEGLPRNMQVAPFVPFGNLLPHVDVMITNGGFGGTQNALAHGIPLVMAGATEDKMEVAARVEYCGAGINLRTQHPKPVNILAAVRKILTNPLYRTNAERLQAEYAPYNAPTQVGNYVDELLATAMVNSKLDFDDLGLSKN